MTAIHGYQQELLGALKLFPNLKPICISRLEAYLLYLCLADHDLSLVMPLVKLKLEALCPVLFSLHHTASQTG